MTKKVENPLSRSSSMAKSLSPTEIERFFRWCASLYKRIGAIPFHRFRLMYHKYHMKTEKRCDKQSSIGHVKFFYPQPIIQVKQFKVNAYFKAIDKKAKN